MISFAIVRIGGQNSSRGKNSFLGGEAEGTEETVRVFGLTLSFLAVRLDFSFFRRGRKARELIK